MPEAFALNGTLLPGRVGQLLLEVHPGDRAKGAYKADALWRSLEAAGFRQHAIEPVTRKGPQVRSATSELLRPCCNPL